MIDLDIKDAGLDFRRKPRKRERTDVLIFHHVGPMPNFDVDAEVIHGWHLDRGDNWIGNAYNLVVLPDGTIELARPLGTVGAHSGSEANGKSIGVCVIGNFEKDNPTEEQIVACVNIGLYVKQEFNENIKITGHNSYSDTACPGKNFPLKELKTSITGRWEDMNEELDWRQKQAIKQIEELAEAGFLNNPDLHIEKIKKGEALPDYVYLSLINRVVKEG